MSLLTQRSAVQQTGIIPFKSLEESESLLPVSTYGLLWILNPCPCSSRRMVAEYHTARDPHFHNPPYLVLAKIMLILKELWLFHFFLILLWFVCVTACVDFFKSIF